MGIAAPGAWGTWPQPDWQDSGRAHGLYQRFHEGVHRENCPQDALFLIAGNRGIDLRAPGIDAATHGKHIREAVAGKIGRDVEAARSALAGKHDAAVLRKRHVLVRGVVVERLGLPDARQGQLLGRADVDEREVLALVEPLLDRLGVDVQPRVGVLGRLDSLYDLLDVQYVVVLAQLSQRVGRLEAAGGAAPHVVALEQGALGGGSDREDLLHGHVGRDRGRRHGVLWGEIVSQTSGTWNLP